MIIYIMAYNIYILCWFLLPVNLLICSLMNYIYNNSNFFLHIISNNLIHLVKFSLSIFPSSAVFYSESLIEIQGPQ